jgi:hypothetical protein
MRWALVSLCGISLISFLCLLLGVKIGCKKRGPRQLWAVSRALGSRTRFLDLGRGYLYHANSVHTAATTGHNVHEMNIDRNGPILQVLIVDFGQFSRLGDDSTLLRAALTPWKRLRAP